jgi:manganese oxidase
VKKNNGFGRHTISTHEHNGHHGYENDGFTGAFFYPGQYYDYHWPIVHAGFGTINTDGSDLRAGSPDGSGGINKVAGDWRETMSTHWFHDHMFSFTAQNVYKGNTAMFNLYSSLDRGNESLNDGINFRLPSGKAKDWGNLDYDVNLMLADKAFDQNGQLYFDIFNLDGF